jgi:hypothetical protein
MSSEGGAAADRAALRRRFAGFAPVAHQSLSRGLSRQEPSVPLIRRSSGRETTRINRPRRDESRLSASRAPVLVRILFRTVGLSYEKRTAGQSFVYGRRLE